MAADESQEKTERWSMKQRKRAKQYILLPQWIFVIQRSNCVPRGDILKDDSGSYAVFTEHGSSASQVAAAKVMDVVARLPGWAGQAADAVSSYTQVKIEDAPTVLKIPRSECPDIWMRLARHKWPKSWSSMEDPVVPLERNLFGHPLAGLLWERQLEKGSSLL